MPQPLALCLEDLDAATEERYLQCVAAVGRGPGLGLAVDGSVLWQQLALACELWATQDDRLALLRREGAPAVQVSRQGRTLEAPPEKPVILRQGDELALGGRRLRLHLHGAVQELSPPRVLRELGRAAAALAVGALLAGAPGSVAADPARDQIEVRQHPPSVVAPEPKKPEPKKPDKKKPEAKKPDKKKPEAKKPDKKASKKSREDKQENKQ